MVTTAIRTGLFIMTAAKAADIVCGVNGCVERHHDYYGERRERERDYYGDRHRDEDYRRHRDHDDRYERHYPGNCTYVGGVRVCQ